MSLEKPYDISSKHASAWANSKEDFPADIQRESANTNTKKKLKKFFESDFLEKCREINVCNINNIEDICWRIKIQYDQDPSISPKQKNIFDSLYEEKKYPHFLYKIFLYVINRPNKTNNVDEENDTAYIDNLLIGENLCPMCKRTPLIEKSSNFINKLYTVVDIYPKSTSKNIKEYLDKIETTLEKTGRDNQILLCSICAKKYIGEKEPEKKGVLYKNLINMKNNIKRKALNNSILEEMTMNYLIDEKIAIIIEKLANLKEDGLTTNTNYSAIKISSKITKDNFFLSNKVASLVAQYYLYVENLFKAKESVNSNKFALIAQQIHMAFIQLDMQALSQPAIFDNLVQWLLKKLNFDNQTNDYSIQYAAEIIIAFFIQNCEVFHDISQQDNIN